MRQGGENSKYFNTVIFFSYANVFLLFKLVLNNVFIWIVADIK